MIWAPLFVVGAAALVLVILLARRHVFNWLPGYLAHSRRRARRLATPGLRHLIFCVADHFEPQWRRPDIAIERRRLDAWINRFPAVFAQFHDADGRHPQHTFFYPAEEYRAEHLQKLARLVADGWGEVEAHLHHDQDTPDGLRAKLAVFKEQLRGHGLLGSDRAGRVRFGFIHGNWSLANSDPRGRWCGINNELSVLAEMGCYADFTLPSAPNATQTRIVNRIYWARDRNRPKPHDFGREAAAGENSVGDLLIIQGPLALDWSARKFGFLPAIENAEISSGRPPDANRVRLWVKQHICVRGRPEWVFVKVHTHGCEERNLDALFGERMLRMHETLRQEFNNGREWLLHYVSAREMFNIIAAARAGLAGYPGHYRNFEVLPPPAKG